MWAVTAAIFRDADALLRGRGAFAAGRTEVPWARVVLLLVAGGLCYGAAMGSFGARAWQAVFSAVKVPILLSVATLICLPSFFVANTLLGLRDDFAAATRGVLTAQATVALVLASMAPVTLFGYVSTSDYELAIVVNGVFFALAATAGQLTLQRHYRPLVARNPRHRIMWVGWLVLYVFVAIQLAWVLRPFIGSPNIESEFFREDAWSNAYVVVFGLVQRVLGL